ncbi:MULTISPECIES: hypothetical protein [unclassified Sphingobacterium]|uniref:hypothetical protein n=1 Tax=unclassified Sphingobacterium TaxID=2609468 RepID=UPI0025D8AEAA|nr:MULTISPECIES: hypothetical protein [unclassified Sphingobacterium]
MWLKIFIVLILILIAYQDFRYRGVTWYFFPLLFLGLSAISIRDYGWHEVSLYSALNLLFIVLQLLILQLYFRIRNGHWQWIFDTVLGWGDVVFFIAIAVYFTLWGYFMFFVLSLGFALVMSLLLRMGTKKEITVPLAGWQAVLFLILFVLEHFNYLSLREIILPNFY